MKLSPSKIQQKREKLQKLRNISPHATSDALSVLMLMRRDAAESMVNRLGVPIARDGMSLEQAVVSEWSRAMPLVYGLDIAIGLLQTLDVQIKKLDEELSSSFENGGAS